MDGGSEEEFSEWEQIQSPLTQTVEHDTGTREEDNDLNQHHLSVFPPSHHQGLEVTSEEEVHAGVEEEEEEEEVNSTAPDSWSSTGADEEQPAKSGLLNKGNEIGKLLKSGIVEVAGRVRCYAALGWGVWSVGAVGGVVAAVLLSLVYAKVRRRWRNGVKEEKKKKDPLVFLIQEKDQKINRLLVQIAHINEMLSARRRVPVIRLS